MRREERHHLKENPLAVILTAFQCWMAERGRNVLVGAGIVMVAFIAAGGYFTWTQVQEQRAGELLASAMIVLSTPVEIPAEAEVAEVSDATGEESDGASDPAVGNRPDVTPDTGDGAMNAVEEAVASETDGEDDAAAGPTGDSYPSIEARLEAAVPELLAVVEHYPNTQQGMIAQYEAAAALMALGRTEEAVAHYSDVIERAADGLYGQMAAMGLAEAHLVRGETAEAIAVLEAKAGGEDPVVPVDAVLMRLGRAYEMADQPDDALAAFSRIVHEFTISVYSTEAQDALLALEQARTAASTSGDE